MLKSTRRDVSLAPMCTLRNSITKRRSGALPRSSARIDACASTTQSSQKAAIWPLGRPVVGIAALADEQLVVSGPTNSRKPLAQTWARV